MRDPFGEAKIVCGSGALQGDERSGHRQQQRCGEGVETDLGLRRGLGAGDEPVTKLVRPEDAERGQEGDGHVQDETWGRPPSGFGKSFGKSLVGVTDRGGVCRIGVGDRSVAHGKSKRESRHDRGEYRFGVVPTGLFESVADREQAAFDIAEGEVRDREPGDGEHREDEPRGPAAGDRVEEPGLCRGRVRRVGVVRAGRFR